MTSSSRPSAPEDDWLLAAIDGQEIRLAMAKPGPTPRLDRQRDYPTRQFVTATDAFQKYGEEVGVDIADRTVALVVSGPVVGDSIRIQRCPWILSLTGLRYVFGKPPLAVNDSAVKSWANLAHTAQSHTSLSAPALPDFTRNGRWATITLQNGLGASLLVRAEGQRMMMVDSEIGHIGFAPHGPEEVALAEAIAKQKGGTSWELALFAHEDRDLWRAAGLPGDPEGTDVARAAMVGSFAGDVVLATGGWSGMFLHCARSVLARPAALAAFNKRFEAKTAYKMEIRRTPRWRADMPAANLTGAALMLWEIEGQKATSST
ncbi:MAG: glucokinase [Pacificimonas sp.]